MLKTYSEVLLSISRSHFITQQLVQWILKFQIVYCEFEMGVEMSTNLREVSQFNSPRMLLTRVFSLLKAVWLA